jgi:hypothetical protein
MAKHEVALVDTEIEQDLGLGREESALVEKLYSKFVSIGSVHQHGSLQITLLRREIGEALLKYRAFKNGNKLPSLNASSYEDRKKFRALAENKGAELLPIAQALAGRHIADHQISVTAMYDNMRLALAYTEADITKAMKEDGHSYTNLIRLAGTASEDERNQILDRAKRETKMSVAAFKDMHEEMRAAEGITQTPTSEKALKSAKARRDNREKREASEDRKGSKNKSWDPVLGNVKTTAGLFSNMTAHIEDHLSSQLADVWTAIADDMAELDDKPRAEAEKKLESLIPQIKGIIDISKKILESYDTYRKAKKK